MATLRERYTAVLDEVAAISQKAASEDRDFTSEEVARINALKPQADELGKQVKAADDAQAIASAHAGRSVDGQVKAMQSDAIAASFTEQIKTRGMVDLASAKSILPTTGSVMLPIDLGTVVLPYARNGISTLIGGQELPAGDSFTYMRQVTRTHNASTVARGAQKPTSVYALERFQGKVMTLAHLSEDIPKQWLADMPALQDFLRSEMTAGLQLEAHSTLLNGGTAEDGTEVAGLLDTTGVRSQAFVTNPLITARKILTTMQLAGEAVTGWVFNPTDWEVIELLRDEQDRPELPGTPTGRAPMQLWGVPVALDPGIEAGTGLVGDWTTVSILTRQGVVMDWSEAGEKFEKNLIKFRAEARIGVRFARPGALATVTLAGDVEGGGS
ncbi:phage major capsid protein [Streptomyces sp. NPDC006976]|uniref:phage major capsid protein n=1 Tax=Streptomyces sp. NPDC006976 TaxID=3154311 RepID=UPI0033DC9CAD